MDFDRENADKNLVTIKKVVHVFGQPFWLI